MPTGATNYEFKPSAASAQVGWLVRHRLVELAQGLRSTMHLYEESEPRATRHHDGIALQVVAHATNEKVLCPGIDVAESHAPERVCGRDPRGRVESHFGRVKGRTGMRVDQK
jgi:hypothetical protein